MKIYIIRSVDEDKIIGYSTSEEIAIQKCEEYEDKYGGWYDIEKYSLEKDSWYEF